MHTYLIKCERAVQFVKYIKWLDVLFTALYFPLKQKKQTAFKIGREIQERTLKKEKKSTYFVVLGSAWKLFCIPKN